MERWFVVNTKPRNEGRAASNLSEGGYDVLAPRIRLRNFRADKFIFAIEPMFPGYILVRFHPVNDFRTIKYTRGVKTIVHFGDHLVPVQDEVVEFIRSRLKEGVAEIQKKPLKRGEKIFIAEGPFKGLTGIFERELEGRERVAILLDSLNYCSRVELDSDLVAPAKDT